MVKLNEKDDLLWKYRYETRRKVAKALGKKLLDTVIYHHAHPIIMTLQLALYLVLPELSL